MKSLKVGIVGGSLAGCAAAILLARADHEVQVFERSRAGLVGRGGGIGTPGPVLDALIEQDIIDRDFPQLSASTMPFVVKTATHDIHGYVPWEMPMNLRTFHWSALWNNLRKRVPDDVYHRGYEVTHSATSENQTAMLQFRNHPAEEFDLVLFADGYQSLGRRLVAPGAELDYRGYVLWRGLLPEGEMADSGLLGSTLPRVSFIDLPGHLITYFVPSNEGSSKEGDRLYNWAAYIPVAAGDLAAFLVDREGVTHTGSIPPGKMRPDEEQRLKQLMVDNLPTYYGDIVSKTQNTYAQLIYTVRLPVYHQGRIALVGDAGMVAQPFTGSGVFKGYNNVKDLLEALDRHENVDDALQFWGRDQVARGNRLLTLGEQMEQAFVWNTLDLATADAESTAAWWKAAVTFPEDFTYQADER